MSGTAYESKELQDLLSHFSMPLKAKIPSRQQKQKVIVIAGPTGVGKTQLSLIIARAIGGEIISADSMQVYRGMDIGTAKVGIEERKEIPHHLIDIRELHESFNVVDFYTEASLALREIFLKQHVPLVVGGTGFFIHALLYGPPRGPPSVPEVREGIEREMQVHGPQILYEKLYQIDPDYAMTITRNDRQKIIRALEIISLTNQKVSYFSKNPQVEEVPYDFRCWFVHMPKEVIYQRIEMRCEKMLSEGLISEVKSLEKKGLEQNPSASQAIGYRQVLDFLATDQSEKEREKLTTAFKQASRHYAKKQFTWFRKEPLFRWLNMTEYPLETAAEIIIQDYELSF
jgi:tRNA dimethylallyltransferase